MKTSEQIRKFYHPIQPTIRQSEENVTYKEIKPNEPLQEFIYCYWQLKTKHQLSYPFNYRVVADGCIDIFFELNDPKNSFVMGFCKKYTEFHLENTFNYIGIRFLPTRFPQIFGIDASGLSNRFEYLNKISLETSEFIASAFNETLNLKKIKKLLDNFFNLKISKTEFKTDSRLHDAVEIILKNFGVVNIEKDLNTGIGQRQLQRLFKYYIGDTAKTFSKVVQFQNILRSKPLNQSLKADKWFYDIGYYDQAHFIKDFKNFYGVTPTKAFNR